MRRCDQSNACRGVSVAGVAISITLAATAVVLPLKADDSLASNEYIDRAVFPKGYGILTSDR